MQRRPGAAGGRLGAVLFTDIVGSTAIAAELGNRRWATLIGHHHQLVRRELRRFGGRENDTAGDGFFVTFERPVDAIRCAVAIAETVRSLGIEIRAGVTFGELELAGGKASGLVVNTAARVMSRAGPGEVLVPASVRDIVSGAGLSFQEHGTHRLKGIEDETRLFVVTAVEGESVASPLEPTEAAERRRRTVVGSTRQRGWAIVGAIAAAAVAAAAIALAIRDGAGSSDKGTTGRSFMAELDPADGSQRQRIEIVWPRRLRGPLGATRSIVAGSSVVWVLDPLVSEGATLLHVDPDHGDVRDPLTIPSAAFAHSMVTAFDALWYVAPDRLVRVSASSDEQQVILKIDLEFFTTPWMSSVTADRDHLWVGKTDGILIRLLPSGEEVRRRKISSGIDLIAADENGVWVVDQVDGEVVRVDPATLKEVWRAPVYGTVGRIAVEGDYVWLLEQTSGVVTRLSSSTGDGSGQASVGRGATDLAVGLGAVWISHLDGTITRIDPPTLSVDPMFAAVEGSASALAVDVQRRSIWVEVNPSGVPGA